jgi:hypothetical protein
LAEFRETFEDDGSGKHVPKTFIRGDVVNANKSSSSFSCPLNKLNKLVINTRFFQWVLCRLSTNLCQSNRNRFLPRRHRAWKKLSE